MSFWKNDEGLLNLNDRLQLGCQRRSMSMQRRADGFRQALQTFARPRTPLAKPV